jgi:hypothetical protein
MVAARISPLAAAALLALLAGCAPNSAPAPAAVAPAAEAGSRYGVIVAERPLRPGASGAGDVRGAILAKLGGAAVVQPIAGTAEEAEFIVRAEDAQTLSVVQDNPQHLRPGERVLIHAGPRTWLSRALSASAAAGGG